MQSKQTGNLGEKIAEEYLKNKGYQILDKNYIPKFVSGPQRGEIDIVAKKEGVISFIEVKALSGSACGEAGFLPEDKVNFSKQRKIIKTAESWLMRNKIPFDSKWQIDVIAIKIDLENRKAKIEHFENAV